MTTVIIKRGRAKPLWFGHPWVYSEGFEKVAYDGCKLIGLLLFCEGPRLGFLYIFIGGADNFPNF